MIDYLAHDVELASQEAENRRLQGELIEAGNAARETRRELVRTRKALAEARAEAARNVTGAENARLRRELARERKDLAAALQRLGACTCGKGNKARKEQANGRAWWV